MEESVSMEKMEEFVGTKVCPFCAENIKSVAVVCRYCKKDLRDTEKDKTGTWVRVRLIVGDKKYTGDIFVPEYLNRLSDVINDKKKFIVLSNAVEENHVRDVPIGFLAVNKNQLERLELMTVDEKKPFEVVSRIIEWR